MNFIHSIFFFLLFCTPFFSFSQGNWDNILEAEEFIYKNEMDSARFYLKELERDEYVDVLNRIVSSNHSNHDLWLFIQASLESTLVDEENKIKFINNKIHLPSSENKIDIDYVRVRSEEHIFLVNSNLLEEAGIVLKELKQYVSRFKGDNLTELKNAQYLINHSDIIYFVIQREIEKGEKLCDQNEVLALELKDTLLLGILANDRAEFLIYKEDLDGYITLMEEAILLEDSRIEKSNIYFKNVINLIEAKSFKGGGDDEVIRLLKRAYSHPRFKVESYYLIIQMLDKKDESSPFYSWVYEEFEEVDVFSVVKKIILESEKKLFPNDVYQVMRISANLLLKKGLYEEAFRVKDESVAFIKTIYAKDLSKAIAANEIEKNEIESQLIVEIEKERANKYLNIMIISIIGLFLFLLGILFLRKKNTILNNQKKEIEKKDFEKQLLLKEIHHRVKNNFQIVSSLLQLQTKGIDDQKAIDLAIEGQNRVKAMALIHQKLYQNDELTVRFQEYVQSLVTDINKAYSTTKINLEIDISPDYTLDIDTAIPLGLILNELVTNSFKYAFHSQKENILQINLEEGDEFQTLIVKDNGKGIDENIDLKKVKSIGLRLVKNLAKQLHGTFSYKVEEGTAFTITYKETGFRELED